MQKRKIEINSILTFALATRNWARCVAYFHPAQQHDADSLVDYVMEMCEELGDWTGALEYFEGVRHERQELVHKPWSTPDLLRYTRCMTQSALRNRMNNTNTSSPSPPSSRSSSPFRTSYCYGWQKGECRVSACRYTHQCDACDSVEHTGAKCPRGPSPGSKHRAPSGGSQRGKPKDS
jgi:hypothetical protein